MRDRYHLIVAIIRTDQIKAVEETLRELRVSGLSVSHVKGYGEYVDLFAGDWMTSSARVEILTSAERTPAIVQAILSNASTGTRGDGIVSVLPVESVWRVRTRSRATAADF